MLRLPKEKDMNGFFNKVLVVTAFTLTCIFAYGQNFEGSITYKVVANNPNPEMIPDSTWQKGMKEQFGEKGYMVQKYYYKKARYISEIDAGKQSGLQAFNPKDGLLYSWQANADEAITLDSKKYMDAFVEITASDKTETILGIPCKSMVLKSKMGQMTLWYNSDHFKMDAKYYKGHIYGYWEQILQEIGCLPLKIEQKGFMAQMTQTAIAYKEESVKDDKFSIPTFKEVWANPVN